MASYYLTTHITAGGTSYGVTGTDNRTTVTYADVTDNKDELQRLVLLCNRESLELCHFEDVLEDFLSFSE
ncbi:MAG: hypothetical protein II118_07755 [Ruminococcus sp.]|jgi:hypothetical protein|nr:DUF6514 family protein [uncultured Ruminococcus sp.]MBQ1350454.1 hypothetical protein [Ruminococcus sp.]MBQ1814746.1 hypothetical protein [Ruminococcus sp.]MBQ2470891.1 hypothetical protein [Ruminococcus sp.]SCX04607.1 hypothetical protein SAMN02910436_00357 [Ruminococcaceae bacterium P7]